MPIKHRFIACEPPLEHIDLSQYLAKNVNQVVAGVESGPQARVCDYSWILSIRDQCAKAGTPFHFKQTGANFVKDGHCYHVDRKIQHSQAAKTGIDISDAIS